MERVYDNSDFVCNVSNFNGFILFESFLVSEIDKFVCYRFE